MKTIPISAFVIILSALSSCYQSGEYAEAEIVSLPSLEFSTPEEAGIDPAALAGIDEMLMRYVEERRIPGAVVLIAKDGKIVYETEIGWSDSSQTEPYTKDHIFRLASMTKPFTSVAIMQLYEQGKINLDDPVSKYIPEFADPVVLNEFNETDTTFTTYEAALEPTIHHLLNHTAGISYAFMNPPVYGAILAKYEITDLATHTNVTIGEKMAVLADLPLIHDPGEQWSYGLNTDVLGRIVEVASGLSLSEYFIQNICDPLGLDDTRFYLASDQADRLVDVYVGTADSTIATMQDEEGDLYHPDYPITGAKSYFSGGSGLSGTARDYFVFAQTMLNGGAYGDVRILKEETVDIMTSNQIGDLDYPWGAATFGYGFDVASGHDHRPDGTFSWGGAFSTTFWIDPENDLVAIMMSQVLFNPNGGKINYEFGKKVYEALEQNPM